MESKDITWEIICFSRMSWFPCLCNRIEISLLFHPALEVFNLFFFLPSVPQCWVRSELPSQLLYRRLTLVFLLLGEIAFIESSDSDNRDPCWRSTESVSICVLGLHRLWQHLASQSLERPVSLNTSRLSLFCWFQQWDWESLFCLEKPQWFLGKVCRKCHLVPFQYEFSTYIFGTIMGL